jgi:hypothetical protein
MTSAIKRFSAPRQAAKRCKTPAHSRLDSRARSMASTCPRIRRTRLRSFSLIWFCGLWFQHTIRQYSIGGTEDTANSGDNDYLLYKSAPKVPPITTLEAASVATPSGALDDVSCDKVARAWSWKEYRNIPTAKTRRLLCDYGRFDSALVE